MPTTTLESIKKPTKENNAAYQRACPITVQKNFTFNNEYAQAENYFLKPLEFDYDKRLHALSHFWLGSLTIKKGIRQSARLFQQVSAIQ